MGVRVSSSSLLENEQAEIAQLVEHNLAKVGVAGPSPVFRSNKKYSTSVFLNLSPSGGIGRRARFRCVCFFNVQVRVLSWAQIFKMVFKCWRGGGIGRRATLRG